MSRPRSAGSVFWGLILISIGLIFLFKNLGYEIPIWTGVSLYWPVLLILWGFIKLVDYARWKRAGEPGPLFGAGEVVLLIIVILSGTALTAASNIGPDFGAFWDFAGVDLFEITGNEYQYTEHYEQDVPGGSSIEIINRYGNVVVTPSETDHVSVDVAKTVIASNQKDADDLSKGLTYSIVQEGSREGSRYRVISSFNRDQNGMRGKRFKTSLTISVPKRSSLTVSNRYGRVDLSGITGDQHVTNGFGETSLKKITGSVDVRSKNDRIIIEDVTGPATIFNEFAGIEARRLGDRLDLRNRYSSVDVEEIKGDAKISNEFGSIQAKKIQGALTVDSRMTSVDVTHVEGNVRVENEFHYVKLEDVRGVVNVQNKNGNVELRYLQPPKNNIRVDSKFGDVKLVLPSASAFSIDAKTQYATISSDFEGLKRQDDSQRGSLTGQIGTGGPEIRLENRNGNIQIEK